MEALLLLFAVIVAIFGLDVMAGRVGVDSRDGSNDPQSPGAGLFV